MPIFVIDSYIIPKWQINWQMRKKYAQLILKLIMERAATLLQQENLSIAAIGASVGYSDTSSFYHAFTKYYKKTPLAYLKAQDPSRDRSESRL